MKLEGYRTILSGVLAAAAGALQIMVGVDIDASQQQRLLEIGVGLLAILGGGGSIVFRILAGLPTLKAAAEEIVKLKQQLEQARKGAPA